MLLPILPLTPRRAIRPPLTLCTLQVRSQQPANITVYQFPNRLLLQIQSLDLLFLRMLLPHRHQETWLKPVRACPNLRLSHGFKRLAPLTIRLEEEGEKVKNL